MGERAVVCAVRDYGVGIAGDRVPAHAWRWRPKGGTPPGLAR